MPNYTAEQKLGSFSVTKSLPIEELSCTLIELRHEPTGARVLHLANNDEENLFCLNFDTHPYSSNGVAHILEHTVLCGSKKFPVKDPFFSMNRRSLNTFMNAMTGSDFTCYPAASQIEKDFYNLLEVYLDAVFYPDLKYLSFLQEGHRFEFETKGDPTSPLLFKGIVFNEMKGTQTSPETRLWNEMMRLMVPDLTYAVNSGGDPRDIPHLTHEGLLKFHQTFYHPRRCLFFFYGNIPLEKHLEFIEKNVLNECNHLPEVPTIPKQKRFSETVKQEIGYPISDQDLSKKTWITFGFLTSALVNVQEILALSLLDTILMDTDASLLKLPLLQSGLCIQADGYLDNDMSEVPYAIVIRGCDKENAEKLETLLFDTLSKIATEGIEQKLIDAAIHQLEFSRTEITGDHYPFGLTLFMRSVLPIQHGGSPEDALTIHAQFDQLRKDCSDKAYLPNLLKKYFLDNPHQVHLIMSPDPDLSKKEEEEEKSTLQKIAESLSEDQKAKIIRETEELAVFQDEQEHQSLDCLPKLAITDIPKKAHEIPLKTAEKGDLTIFHHECFTNQIIYADLLFDLPHFTKEELPYLQLFSSLMTELGAKDRSYVTVLEEMQEATGGIGTYLTLYPQFENRDNVKPAFGIRGKALSRHQEKFFSLLQDFVRAPRVDEKDRIKELIMQIYNSLHNQVRKSPLSYAIKMSLSGFSKYATIQELWGGLTFYHFIEDLANNLDAKLPEILEALANIKTKLLHYNKPHLVLSCDHQDYKKIEKNKFYNLTSFDPISFKPWENPSETIQFQTQARIIPSGVAFTAHGFETITVTHADSPALSLSTFILENKVLHKKIREQGGAYGSGASYHPLTGKYYFYAYRDPHLKTSLDAFAASLDTLANGEITEQELNEAKFGLMQRYDSPISPGSRAITGYNFWRDAKTLERRQKYRDDVLRLTIDQVQKAAQNHLLKQYKSGITIAFSGKELLEKENLSIEIFNI